MTVRELVGLASNSKNKLLKPEQLQAMLKKELEVKEYLGIKDKKQLVENIVNECVLWDNGVFKFDEIEKYIVFTMRTIAAYTNIELSTDIEDDYDELCRTKLLGTIVGLFEAEYNEVSLLLRMKCDYILNENGIEMQVGKFLSNISGKLDIFAEKLSNQVENFDISKLPIKEEDLTQLLTFINTQK